MLSFWLTLLRLLKALRLAWREPGFRTTVLLVAGLLLSSTLFFRAIEGWRWLDALYYSVTTVSTVGYGDLSPKTDLGKIFAMMLMVVGIGLFVALVTQVARALLEADPDDNDGKDG